MFDTPLKQDYKDKVGEDPTKHFTDEELKERDRHWRGNLGQLSLNYRSLPCMHLRNKDSRYSRIHTYD